MLLSILAQSLFWGTASSVASPPGIVAMLLLPPCGRTTGQPAVNIRRSRGRIAISPNGQEVLWVNSSKVVLSSMADGGQITTLPHPARVESVAFAPDGRRAVTTTWKHRAYIWDLQAHSDRRTSPFGETEFGRGKVLVELTGHEGPVTSAMFSDDGKRVVTASADGTARYWDAQTGKELGKLDAAKTRSDTYALTHVPNALFLPDGKVLVNFDSEAYVWDFERGERGWHLSEDDVHSVSLTSDGKMCIVGLHDEVALIDLGTKKKVKSFSIKSTNRIDPSIRFAEVSPDQKHVLVGESSVVRHSTVSLWNIEGAVANCLLHDTSNRVTPARSDATFSWTGDRFVCLAPADIVRDTPYELFCAETATMKTIFRLSG